MGGGTGHRGLSSASRRTVGLLLFVAVVLALNLGGSWLTRQIEFQVFPRHDAMLEAVVLVAAALYVLLMALPFMPGIELGLALLVLLGAQGAILVYACTVTALCLSFALGRWLPPRYAVRALGALHLDRAATLVAELEPLAPHQRLQRLAANAPTRLVPFLLRHRHLTVAVALNLPGNALIGGGGGIGLVVGMSGLMPWRHYVAVIALAVAPVPLFFLCAGA